MKKILLCCLVLGAFGMLGTGCIPPPPRNHPKPPSLGGPPPPPGGPRAVVVQHNFGNLPE